MSNQILPTLKETIEKLIAEFSDVPKDRIPAIKELTDFIAQKSKAGMKTNLNFICTHNSRRSHISQLWAQAAAYYYGISNVYTFSGGTEATAFNPRAVNAMERAGFDISIKKDGTNPLYEARYAENAIPIELFSKKYDDPFNPNKDFAAIMTCSQADQNCPLVIGASKRIALTYDDPKEFDGTSIEEAKYDERVMEIGREILYAFSKVK